MTTINSNTKSIAIALCLYQGERFLAQQLDSILAQSHTHFYLHIFDDVSTDNSLAIIERYQQIHDTIYLHKNKKRLGFVKNFEQAIKKLSSQSSYIALCDQDDIWHPDKLKTCHQALEQLEQQYPNTPCLVHSDLKIIDEKNKLQHPSFFAYKTIQLPNKKSLEKILGYNGVMGNTLLMNHALAQCALPFPKTLKYHDYWLALVNETFGVRKTLYKPLISYRIHTNNSSENRKSTKKTPQAAPFTEDNRQETLAYFLSHYSPTSKDKKIITAFYHYLDPNKNKIKRTVLLFRHGFLRPHWHYRLRVLRRLLFS